MARPRQFSTDDALESAMQLFWSGGYHATSTREIEKALGLGRQSIYNAFGDKESLYHTSLDRYAETVLEDRTIILKHPEAGRREIVKFLAHLVEALDADPARRGCFLVNALAEFGQADDHVAEFGRSHADSVKVLLKNAVDRSIASGEIASGTNSDAVSKMLVAMETGMSLAARRHAERKDLVDMASAALQPLY
jgi:TetR/AcrR family transcriptional regulator, transcriptional repressor for nem operon